MNFDYENARLRDLLTRFLDSSFNMERGNDVWYASFLLDMRDVALEVGNDVACEYADNLLEEMQENINEDEEGEVK